MSKILNFFYYFFCIIFKIVRYKKYIICDGKLSNNIKINNPQIGLIIKKNEEYLKVENIIDEVINNTLIYEYIYTIKIKWENNNNNND